jgi:dipeptidase E
MRLLLISSSRVHPTGYLDHCEEEIRDFLGRVRRVLFVPYALRDWAGYAGRFRDRLQKMGFEVDSLGSTADPGSAVRSCQSLFVGGGNTFRLLHELYEKKLLDPIRARAREGMPYLGSSAGTNIACPTIKTTNDMPIVQPRSLEALGLIPFNINPHYLDPDPSSTHAGETREERIREFHEMNDPPVVGLREGAMLRVEEDRVILRGASGARLFFKGQAPRDIPIGDALDSLLT